jgi:hypothetical protein
MAGNWGPYQSTNPTTGKTTFKAPTSAVNPFVGPKPTDDNPTQPETTPFAVPPGQQKEEFNRPKAVQPTVATAKFEPVTIGNVYAKDLDTFIKQQEKISTRPGKFKPRKKVADITQTRELTQKQFDALSNDRKDLVRFSTEFYDKKKAGDEQGLKDLQRSLGLKDVSVDDFRKGVATITDEELWGTDRKQWKNSSRGKPAAGQPAKGFFDDVSPLNFTSPRDKLTGQVATRTTGATTDQTDRDRMVSKIVDAVGRMFDKRAESTGNRDQLNSILAVPSAAGAPRPGENKMADLATALKLDDTQVKFLDEWSRILTQKSVWNQKGASVDQVYANLKANNVSPEQFAEYMGTVTEMRHKNGEPMSGNAKDTLSRKEFLTKLRIQGG